MNPLTEYIAQVRELALRLIREGKGNLIKQEIKKLRRSFNLDEKIDQATRDTVRNATNEAQREFIEKYFDGSRLMSVELDNIAAKLEKKVIDLIRSSKAQTMTEEQIADQLVKLGQVEQRHARTVVNTVAFSLRQGALVADVQSVGIQNLKYSGPVSLARPFCAAHVGQTYTVEQVMQMTNDFGQPAFSMRGGWNCRHRWVAVQKNQKEDEV